MLKQLKEIRKMIYKSNKNTNRTIEIIKKKQKQKFLVEKHNNSVEKLTRGLQQQMQTSEKNSMKTGHLKLLSVKSKRKKKDSRKVNRR